MRNQEIPVWAESYKSTFREDPTRCLMSPFSSGADCNHFITGIVSFSVLTKILRKLLFLVFAILEIQALSRGNIV